MFDLEETKHTVEPTFMKSNNGKIIVEIEPGNRLVLSEGSAIMFAANLLSTIDCDASTEEIAKELLDEYCSDDE